MSENDLARLHSSDPDARGSASPSDGQPAQEAGAGQALDYAATEFTFSMVDQMERLERLAEDATPDELVDLLVRIRDARAELDVTYHALEKELIAAAGAKQWEVPGHGYVEIKGKVKRTQWQSEDLLRAVFDSRLINQATGEITDETPVEKVLHVWRLGVPRVTALRERGFQIDEWCQEDFEGWTVKLPARRDG